MLPVENRWSVTEVPAEVEREQLPALARALGIPPLVARLLWLRGVRDVTSGRAFLVPRLADLESPDVLPDIDVAAGRIASAVKRGERIAIYGDYDVDGMTGTAVLVRFLGLAGGTVSWAIPDRDADGYGLGPAAVDRFAEAGAGLIVTVDNGVASHAAVDRARARGLDVVVTDHHLPGADLPQALAIVNPERRDAGGAGRGLCGCALAFKTAWAVADRLRAVASPERLAGFKAFLRDAVGLVALATISDVVPLRGENRILVAAGLGALRSSEHPGVRALLETCRVGALPLTSEDVAFRIAPRINAAGRLSKPDLVIDLLTAEDPTRAHRFARCLADANAERRRIEKRVLEVAADQAEAVLGGGDRQSLVVHGEGWHRGVIGIVAARLVDRHHRPTVVIGFEGGRGRGSCRTPAPFDLHQALGVCGAHLSRYGGHAAAAGLEIDQGEIGRFADAFEHAVREQIGSAAPKRTLSIDAETTPNDWSLEAVESIARLQPFGQGNPTPLFLIRGAQVAGRVRLMGQDSTHLTFALHQTGGAIRVVGFRKAALHDRVASGGLLDLVVEPTINEWRGRRTAELRLVDLREAQGARAAYCGGPPPSK